MFDPMVVSSGASVVSYSVTPPKLSSIASTGVTSSVSSSVVSSEWVSSFFCCYVVHLELFLDHYCPLVPAHGNFHVIMSHGRYFSLVDEFLSLVQLLFFF